jgi:hypothetical protein
MAIRVERLSSHPGVLILLFVGLLAPAGVSGQETIVPLQLSFSDPGARSMGFGGAFVALADDATAAFANPAGLVQLLRPEVSVEGRPPHRQRARFDGWSPVGDIGIRCHRALLSLGGVSAGGFVARILPARVRESRIL